MSSPEYSDAPAEIFGSEAVAQTLEQLEKEDYAEAIRAVENVGLARHLVGYGRDIEYAHALLRPQLPKQAREVFEGGYRTLVALHESSLADYAERTAAFLRAYPGVLQYTERTQNDKRVIITMKMEPADSVHRAAWLSVVDDHEERVWLASGQLQCDVSRFDPALRDSLIPLLRPDETA